MEIRRIGIIANIRKEKAPELIIRLKEWAKGRGVEVVLEREIAKRMAEPGGVDREDIGSRVDMIVAFGGDGTLLMAARSVRKFNVPILGINLGAFGYLTVFNLNEMIDALEMIYRGDYRTEKRMMLDVEVHSGDRTIEDGSVLNDVVINRGNLSRMVDLEVIVDDRYLTTYKADGLIVSTPTGSTAYSLSAGGPIVFPMLHSIIINPICPHTLTNRPVMLPENAGIRVVLWSKGMGATATLDGQLSYDLRSGDSIVIRKSKYVTNLVTSPRRDYLQILRSKLGWGGSPTGGKRQ
ncbi:MAG TPA: NAD(+)/NADH kinase [Syntrophales bacterium]|nr:NAD(+)/NADH kinase [Syntrophales bacterium]HOX95583.1 NAD(+)/NADH kinase [Syntrophales bacterium]HPI55769.1 NAD(+)/NADH kinase [Syntrophales bacterium]HPN23739.1 NAD(+)/NADH kinase [Syntrophales bacterium]HQM27735.1 NAD(+)/NADH kinase [Syntrophales bacterium]